MYIILINFFFEDAFLIIDFEDLLLVESRDYF